MRVILFITAFFYEYILFSLFISRPHILFVLYILCNERNDDNMDVKQTDVKKEGGLRQFEKLIRAIGERITPDAFMHPLCFVISFLLAKSILLGSIAPFGLSASGALGAKRGSVCALLGACLGYITMLDRINSLKYLACVILIYTAHFVFSGMTVAKSKVFAAMSVAVPTVCINFVFLADASFPVFDTALALLDILIAVICAILFSVLVSPRATRSNLFLISCLTLCAALLAPLCEVVLFNTVSLGNTLIFALVLLSAFTGGANNGMLVGMVLGLFISLSLSSPEYSLLCGALGVTGTLCSRKGKFLSCFLPIPFALFIAICLDPVKFTSRLFELIAAGALFLLCADVFSRYTRRFFVKNTARRDVHIRRYTSEKLNLASKAFSALGQLVAEAGKGTTTETPASATDVLKNTSGEVCKSCTLSEICWQRDFNTTKDALNNAALEMEKNGILSVKDFPIHFSSRCLHMERFISHANKEIFSAKYKRGFEKKLKESHSLITRQYKEAAEIFSSVSSDISDNARFDEEAESSLSHLLSSYGILCDVAVYRDSHGRINVHLCGKDLSLVSDEFEKLKKAVCAAVGVRLSPPQYTRGKSLDDIIMRELAPLRASFGASVKRRCGSDISGDSGSFFCPENGFVALLLSDGMGTGKLAAKESAINVTLLESLLKSGIAPQNALNTLHGALSLRNEYTMGFATLDLMYADMFDGECEFYKLGGAPTYIKRGRHIRRITSSSLPAGMSIDCLSSPDRTTLKLISGDFVIMTSDGICDGGDDRKIIEFLSKSDETAPKALADSILAYSLALYGKNDDMTVAVVHIEDAF